MNKNLKVDLSKCYNEKCTCVNSLWRKTFVVKRVPGILIGEAGKDGFMEVEILSCAKCFRPHHSYMHAVIEPAPKDDTTTPLIATSKPD
jgi:hypothetical protein